MTAKPYSGARLVPLTPADGEYYRYEQRLTRRYVEHLLRQGPCVEAKQELAASKRRFKPGVVFSSMGLPLLITGGLGTIVVLSAGKGYSNIFLPVTLTAGLAGLASTTVGLSLYSASTERFHTAVQLYNNDISRRPKWQDDTIRLSPSQALALGYDIQAGRIDDVDEFYTHQRRRLNSFEVLSLIYEGGDRNAIELANEVTVCLRKASALRKTGVPLFSASIFVGYVTATAENYYAAGANAVFAGVGAFLLVSGFTAHYKGKSKLRKAVQYHNQSIQDALDKK